MKTFVPLSYDLLLVKAKMQKNFKYLFDDRVCYVKVDDDENKTRQMEYLLESEIGIHDYPNPITGKMADHISPVLGILKMFLGFCRGLTNILLWKDPYASFWICVFNLLFFLFLLVFPWRIFFFLVGFGALGPQVCRLCNIIPTFFGLTILWILANLSCSIFRIIFSKTL